jgi:hypothetical protein
VAVMLTSEVQTTKIMALLDRITNYISVTVQNDDVTVEIR